MQTVLILMVATPALVHLDSLEMAPHAVVSVLDNDFTMTEEPSVSHRYQ